jgi:4-hydroxybenzoate polyprenyltransferase
MQPISNVGRAQKQGFMQTYRSKLTATWLAILAGTLGAHRFYLKGWRDPCGWLYPLPALAGWIGVQRMRQIGQDDLLSWALIPLLGLAISAAMLSAIVYGLTPDARWDQRHNLGHELTRSGPGTVLGVIVALLIGASVLMGTVAFSGQKFFEWQAQIAVPDR